MNWEKLKLKVEAGKRNNRNDRHGVIKASVKPLAAPVKPVVNNDAGPIDNTKLNRLDSHLSKEIKAKYVALDCEMVGLGVDGKTSALARCCVVDFAGKVLYDEFVRPPGFVTDFRTKWSGVRKQDLRQGEAVSLQECRTAVAQLLNGRVLVGHALKNDLDVLLLSHSRRLIRDTALYRPLMRSRGTGRPRPRALRDLAREHLRATIQTGEHDPSEDARTAMFLYRLHRVEWEASLARAPAKDTKVPEAAVATINNVSCSSSSCNGGKAEAAMPPTSVDGKDDISGVKRKRVADVPCSVRSVEPHPPRIEKKRSSVGSGGMFGTCSHGSDGSPLLSIDSISNRMKPVLNTKRLRHS